MKTLRKLALAALAAALAFGSAAVYAQEYNSRMIRFGYGLSPDSNQGRAAEFFAEDLAQRTGNRLRVRSFGSSTLGSDIQMQNALLGGAQEMMVGSTATLVGIVPEFGVFDLPFLFANEYEADTILDGPFGQSLIAKLEDKGLIGLVYWENGFRNLTNSRRPINRVEDLRGIRLRVMQNPIYLDMFRSFGANPVPLPFSELFTALETGAVDGQENPVNTIRSSKFYEVQQHLALTRHVYSPWIVLASKRWWDRLNDAEKQAIHESAIASRDFERRDSREAGAEAVAYLKANGMQVTEPSAEEIARMRELSRPALEKFASDGHADLIAALEAELAKLRQ